MEQGTDYQWAGRLGLAITPLFGSNRDSGSITHSALLDGVAGSFAFSNGVSSFDESISNQLESWTWSSNLRHHVSVSEDSVILRSSSIGSRAENFSRKAVESNLEGFFKMIENSKSYPSIDVVEHMVAVFQKHRRESRIPAEFHMDSYLALLSLSLEYGFDQLPDAKKFISEINNKYKIKNAVEAIGLLSEDYLRRFSEELGFCIGESKMLDLELAIRHAGGPIFQEAHSIVDLFVRQQALFGLSGEKIRPSKYVTGVFYTPQGLARSMADFVLARVDRNANIICIADVACGSGIFLVESVNALIRRGYTGKIKLYGNDISEEAIKMAYFNIACLNRDIDEKKIQIEYHLSAGDFFQANVPWNEVDCIMMNPPFISWEEMSAEQKEQTRVSLGKSYTGRPDYSTAFISEVLKKAKPSTWIGSLMPVGVLSSNYGEKLREQIKEMSNPALIGTLGDHRLFRNAIVNIGLLVIQKKPAFDDSITMLWSGERKNSASTALRELRRFGHVITVRNYSGDGWALYSSHYENFRNKSHWLPGPNSVGQMLSKIKNATRTTVKDIFTIKQGVKTGLREAFIISSQQFSELPQEEKVFFKPVAESRFIEHGRIYSESYIFYPDATFSGAEEDIADKVPVFFETHFKKYIDRLKQRKKTNPQSPGKLTWERIWQRERLPRIISKVFSRNFGFALDEAGEYVIVQGYAWIMKKEYIPAKSDQNPKLYTDMLKLYCAFLNSDIFFKLVQEYSTNVSGGQYELAPKYLNDIPFPDIEKSLDQSLVLQNIAGEIINHESSESDFSYVKIINHFAAMLYGTSYEDWGIK